MDILIEHSFIIVPVLLMDMLRDLREKNGFFRSDEGRPFGNQLSCSWFLCFLMAYFLIYRYGYRK